MTLAEIADLLEQAASAIRVADASLNDQDISIDRRLLQELDGYNHLSVRTKRSLRSDRKNEPQIFTVSELTSKTAENLLARVNFGYVSLGEVRVWLGRNNLHLKGELPTRV